MYKREKWRQVLRFIYAGMMCFLLLDYLGIMTGFDEAASVPDWIWIGRLAAAALGVWLSKNWKNAVFQLLSLFHSKTSGFFHGL